MNDSLESMVECLKGMIDNNGSSYLVDEPYEVYKALVISGKADRKTASAMLHFLVSQTLEYINPDYDAEELSKVIRRECSLNKRMADRIAITMYTLYSGENKKKWKSNELRGLKQFLSEQFICTWKGFAVWDEGNGTVDCRYEARIILVPTKDISIDSELSQHLKKNSFMKKEAIHDLFEKRLKEYLDYQFEEYCTEDDYYQPVVEDYGINLEYDLKKWCEENRFEFVSVEGDGGDDGYEPKYRKGRY